MGLRKHGMIDVTDCDLGTLVRAAYSPSRQQGLGVFDGRGRSNDGLSDKDVKEILGRGEEGMCAVSMDYVHGRSIKMTVYRDDDGKLYMENRWYDHSDDELENLLKQIGLSGDLINKARADQAAYREASKSAAIQYLRAHGGEVKENRGLARAIKADEILPTDVSDGLYSARADKMVTEEYRDGVSIWRLAANRS